jgi:hypothetical protein
VWLLSLDGQWRQATAQHWNGHGGIFITNAAAIDGGMSGSPILARDGRAVGVVGTSMTRRALHAGLEETHTEGGPPTEGGPQARLTAHLPAWFVAGAAKPD